MAKTGRAFKSKKAIKKESHERSFPGLQTREGLRGSILYKNRGFLLMAAGMLVLVMPVAMHVLVRVRHCFMAVLVTVMSMSGRFMRVLVLMLVFVVAAHRSSLLSVRILSISVTILTTCRTFRQAYP